MSNREEELRKVIEDEKPEVEEEEASRWDFRNRANWKFSLGRKRWGFWLLVLGFVLFLVSQFIIKPMMGG